MAVMLVVLEGLVRVDVRVAIAQEQPDAGRHQDRGAGLTDADAIAEKRDREGCAREGGRSTAREHVHR
jgi:hypothetical protein